MGCAGTSDPEPAASAGTLGPARTLGASDFSARSGNGVALDINGLGQGRDAMAAPASNRGSASELESGQDSGLASGLASGIELLSLDQATEGLNNVSARAGTPTSLTPANPQALGDPVFIDAKLGDINGNPIFASVFLDSGGATVEPIGRRLAEEAKKRPIISWRNFAREEITKRVGLFIRDEVLRAEALATLSADQRQGFLAFIDRLQRDAQRRLGGSRAVAERTLSQTEGVTFDQWKQRERDRKLIEFQLQEKVSKRVQVSSREISQRYDQLSDRFNRPPLATFRQIVVPGNKADAIAAVQQRIDAGEAFETLAKSDLNMYKRADGGVELREVKGERAKGEYFGNPGLNEAARTMMAGQTIGPIDVSTGKAWLHLESIQERTQDLYDAQLVLEDQIREERFTRSLERYFTRLVNRMSITDTNEVVEQLAQIAERRYFPTATPAAAPAGGPATAPVTPSSALPR